MEDDAETAIPTDTFIPAATPTLSIIAMENCLAETAVEIEVLDERFDVTETITLPRQTSELTIKLMPATCSIAADQLLYRLVTVADPDPEYQDKPNLEYIPSLERETDIILVNFMIDGGSYTRSIPVNINISN